MIKLNRRRFLRGLFVSPAIIAIERLMPVKALISDPLIAPWRHIAIVNNQLFTDGKFSGSTLIIPTDDTVTELISYVGHQFDFGSGDFTMEAWVGPNRLVSDLRVVQTRSLEPKP